MTARRLARRAAAVLALLAAVGLAGACGGNGVATPTPQATAEVAGDVGVRPTITLPPGFQVTESTNVTLVEGDGPELVDGQSVLLDYLGIDVVTGQVVADTYAALPEIRTLSVESLGQPLYALLAGASVGSRLERVEIGTDANPDPHVLVVDIRPTRASGETLPADATLPAVTLADDGAPTITVPSATSAPAVTTSSTLIKGSGAQVAAGQSVVVQLTSVRWADGAVIDSTWGVAPRAVPLSDLGPGLTAGLVEQTVGSQVLVVVPPAEGNGVDTLVYVVDILATGDVALPPSGTEGLATTAP